MQDGVNIKKDESGNKRSKQMNTWALLSNWSHDDFHNEPLVTSLNSPKYPLDCSFTPVEIAILLWKPFIDLFLHKPPFRVFSSCFSFLGMPFFIFFCFTVRLKLELCSKWMKFFYFHKEENSLAQIPAFDPNGLSKYVT